jgi:hypothetical protein
VVFNSIKNLKSGGVSCGSSAAGGLFLNCQLSCRRGKSEWTTTELLEEVSEGLRFNSKINNWDPSSNGTRTEESGVAAVASGIMLWDEGEGETRFHFPSHSGKGNVSG